MRIKKKWVRFYEFLAQFKLVLTIHEITCVWDLIQTPSKNDLKHEMTEKALLDYSQKEASYFSLVLFSS